ncbi:ubiquinol-cytochrome c reductase iron-sulfur subunit [Deinococcus sonorensis]|uniref:Ubiquinol-cytochrome c reductase iron-sulfur subunit n=2 Tax=Deinococcus sonorensis TaxID=309891 RepID=A0AAU7UG14_9DEIO
MTRLTRRAVLERWWLLPVGATVGVFGFMGLYAARVSRKSVPGAPQFVGGPAVRVAALPQLDREWAEVQFAYAGRPCTVLRLPEATLGGLSAGGQHYAAFSRVCTHLGCPVNLVRDVEVLAFSFNYRAPNPQDQHPQLGCPCHFSVFDPLRSGEAVFGKAHLPLPRVRLERRGDALWATGIEAAPAIGG